MPLKSTEAFRAVSRRGKWVHGNRISVGTLPNGSQQIRVGLRVRRGLKGAAERNRLKRQVRGLIFTESIYLAKGLDIIILLRPPTAKAKTSDLAEELRKLCRRTGSNFQACG